MPAENTPIVVDREVISTLGLRLKNAAVGGDDVMYGLKFVDENGTVLPATERVSTPDFAVGPVGPLPALDNVRVTVGSDEFTTGAALVKSVGSVTTVAFSRMAKLRDRLDQYGQDLDEFLDENAEVENLNQLSGLSLQEHVTFYEITDEGATG
ncbi:hypothetical protein FB565_000307 [Actinoplanes lutulentus]|uniref:Uncharacterized protein n=1 Tax=Actinoplanes lutulentus TaxID=1287878 RepID=A0A327ZNP2_9ACTN|nr:hypothetical protein [Actinoplanes lutulentus]MBB2940603.1 hypothetical protein [Actinoplanes lutulentus]RAK42914.1 hypothetical protein B0I29_10144 [Actinoplanes lutulentus]